MEASRFYLEVSLAGQQVPATTCTHQSWPKLPHCTAASVLSHSYHNSTSPEGVPALNNPDGKQQDISHNRLWNLKVNTYQMQGSKLSKYFFRLIKYTIKMVEK